MTDRATRTDQVPTTPTADRATTTDRAVPTDRATLRAFAIRLRERAGGDGTLDGDAYASLRAAGEPHAQPWSARAE
ncbi:hypothetical protein, partial [Streptomyces sp. SID3343]|uniref:hypothetical protein n=1 Tax=Streptomyces sp. SID3343 TaxID=2690260 RepID=UPI00137095EF